MMFWIGLFCQSKRLTAAEAIRHPYLSEGRLRYHTCMCSCCLHMPSGAIITSPDLDPTCIEPFKPHFEDDLVSASTVRGKLIFQDHVDRKYMDHIVDSCPVTQGSCGEFDCSLMRRHDDNEVNWLRNMASTNGDLPNEGIPSSLFMTLP